MPAGGQLPAVHELADYSRPPSGCRFQSRRAGQRREAGLEVLVDAAAQGEEVDLDDVAGSLAHEPGGQDGDQLVLRAEGRSKLAASPG